MDPSSHCNRPPPLHRRRGWLTLHSLAPPPIALINHGPKLSRRARRLHSRPRELHQSLTTPSKLPISSLLCVLRTTTRRTMVLANPISMGTSPSHWTALAILPLLGQLKLEQTALTPSILPLHWPPRGKLPLSQITPLHHVAPTQCWKP